MNSTQGIPRGPRHRTGSVRAVDLVAAHRRAVADVRIVPGIATVPLPRIDVIGNAAVDVADELYRLGAWVLALVRLDREQCEHCREVGHGTLVRFHPNPDPAQRNARTSVPDACGHCAPTVLRELLDEAGGRDVHVEVWHPRAVA
ncbi:hypothetical protein [Amycolatopsis solani]|uniref:hypothetical protein n=1 Tax=Amycolatopsis solani TaxID=3028615 RepID=UPI0025B23A4E|nr:hypothetical protein [Amycolatopsis sp. MEP2-6]